MASAGAAAPMPSISLDFGKTNKAWDDRELVNAYDAALLEFHIHNPGPGSWLDKATAALAKGQPLPGAADFGTAWYSASKETKEAKEPARKKLKSSNPYASAPTASGSGKQQTVAVVERAESPTYQPASPAREENQWDEVAWPPEEAGEGDEVEGEEEEGWQGYDGYGDAVEEAGHVFPPPSGEWPGAASVGRDEAIGYALHAQYWAGYWMGVAHGAGGPRAGSATRGQGRTVVPNGLKR